MKIFVSENLLKASLNVISELTFDIKPYTDLVTAFLLGVGAPRYYYEDIESKKIYTLSIESPYNLVTLKIADMIAEQKQRQPATTAKSRTK